jgi:hypothetical protein
MDNAPQTVEERMEQLREWDAIIREEAIEEYKIRYAHQLKHMTKQYEIAAARAVVLENLFHEIERSRTKGNPFYMSNLSVTEPELYELTRYFKPQTAWVPKGATPPPELWTGEMQNKMLIYLVDTMLASQRFSQLREYVQKDPTVKAQWDDFMMMLKLKEDKLMGKNV